jgi:hypothetical protein
MRDIEMPGTEAADGPLNADFLAEFAAKRRGLEAAPVRRSEKMPAKIYVIMALTSLMTFATLAAS